MAINRPQTSAKVQGTQGPKDAARYLADLEALLKRNTGQGTFVGQDTSSNTPMYLPGKVANPTGLNETPSTMMSGNGMTQPAPVDRPEVQEPAQEFQSDQNQPGDLAGFLNQFTQSIYNPSSQGTPSSSFLERLYQVTGQLYGVQSMADGTIKMNDGSVQLPGQGQPVPIRSNADGTVGMSDGTSRRLNPNIAQQLGLQGFTQGLFGQNLDVTQEFGNYNPQLEPGSGYNMGTDLRTKNLTQPGVWPVDAKVVGITQDDGTQWGDQSGHQGYGNSVLVELPTGERIRMSHLSSLPQIGPDGMLKAGTQIQPGQTGNVTGEHLDYEYYAPGSERPSDPSQFSGFTNPMQFLPEPQKAPQAPSVPQVAQSQPQSPQVSYPGQTINEGIVKPAVEAVKQAPSNVFNAAKEANPVQAEFGASEGLVTPEAQQARVSALSQQPKQYNPFRQLLGNVSERIGDTLGLPESAFSETLAGGPTKRTNQAFADEIGGDRPEQVAGIRQNIKDIGSQIGTGAQSALGQAGEGIKSLGQAGIGALGNIFKPKQDIAKRAIGDVAGTANAQPGQTSSLMDSAPSMSSVVPNDIRDPFFKSGGSEAYKNFIKPGAIDNSGGALTLDLFNDEFYQNPDNIQSVFGDTYLAPQAQQKYETFAAEQRRIEEEQNRPQPTLDDYLRQGKTVDQWYAETGQQSTRDNLRGIEPKAYGQLISQDQPQQGTYTPAQARQVGSSSGRGVQSVQYPSGRTVQAAPNSSLRADSGGSVQQVRTGGTPVSAPSAQLAYRQPKPQSAPQPNIFSKAVSGLKNIFRR